MKRILFTSILIAFLCFYGVSAATIESELWGEVQEQGETSVQCESIYDRSRIKIDSYTEKIRYSDFKIHLYA